MKRLTILEILETLVRKVRRRPRKKRDLSGIAGSWDEKDAEEFNRNVEIFEQVDEEMWR